ncbi:axoneme-associated protein mst101(2) isoform X2 [Drosophila busckii]|uniref:axoneme-associated protein mst101(2) isoform X2 n=1 Tax=Drosophila busckii TaxID=30019 RepID=UPI001432BC6E|nr:axoneme-associated protein mst101(2) isoform X2 [Drosophila busckii]
MDWRHHNKRYGRCYLLEQRERISIEGRGNVYLKRTQTQVHELYRRNLAKDSVPVQATSSLSGSKIVKTSLQVKALNKKIENEIDKLKNFRNCFLHDKANNPVNQDLVTLKAIQATKKKSYKHEHKQITSKQQEEQQKSELESSPRPDQAYFRTMYVIPTPKQSVDTKLNIKKVAAVDSHLVPESKQEKRISGGCAFGNVEPSSVYNYDYNRQQPIGFGYRCPPCPAFNASCCPHHSPCITHCLPGNFAPNQSCQYGLNSAVFHQPECNLFCGKNTAQRCTTDLNTNELVRGRYPSAMPDCKGKCKSKNTPCKCFLPNADKCKQASAAPSLKDKCAAMKQQEQQERCAALKKQQQRMRKDQCFGAEEKMIVSNYMPAKPCQEDEDYTALEQPHMHRQYFEMYKHEQDRSAEKDSSCSVSDVDIRPTYTKLPNTNKFAANKRSHLIDSLTNLKCDYAESQESIPHYIKQDPCVMMAAMGNSHKDSKYPPKMPPTSRQQSPVANRRERQQSPNFANRSYTPPPKQVGPSANCAPGCRNPTPTLKLRPASPAASQRQGSPDRAPCDPARSRQQSPNWYDERCSPKQATYNQQQSSRPLERSYDDRSSAKHEAYNLQSYPSEHAHPPPPPVKVTTSEEECASTIRRCKERHPSPGNAKQKHPGKQTGDRPARCRSKSPCVPGCIDANNHMSPPTQEGRAAQNECRSPKPTCFQEQSEERQPGRHLGPIQSRSLKQIPEMFSLPKCPSSASTGRLRERSRERGNQDCRESPKRGNPQNSSNKTCFDTSLRSEESEDMLPARLRERIKDRDCNQSRVPQELLTNLRSQSPNISFFEKKVSTIKREERQEHGEIICDERSRSRSRRRPAERTQNVTKCADSYNNESRSYDSPTHQRVPCQDDASFYADSSNALQKIKRQARSPHQSPDRSQGRHQSPDRSQGRHQSPDRSQGRHQSPDRSQGRHQSPDRSQGRHQSPDRSQGRHQSPDRSQGRHQSPDRSQGRHQSPGRSQCFPQNETYSQAPDCQKYRSPAPDYNASRLKREKSPERSQGCPPCSSSQPYKQNQTYRQVTDCQEYQNPSLDYNANGQKRGRQVENSLYDSNCAEPYRNAESAYTDCATPRHNRPQCHSLKSYPSGNSRCKSECQDVSYNSQYESTRNEVQPCGDYSDRQATNFSNCQAAYASNDNTMQYSEPATFGNCYQDNPNTFQRECSSRNVQKSNSDSNIRRQCASEKSQHMPVSSPCEEPRREEPRHTNDRDCRPANCGAMTLFNPELHSTAAYDQDYCTSQDPTGYDQVNNYKQPRSCYQKQDDCDYNSTKARPALVCEKRTRSVTFEDECGVTEKINSVEHCHESIDWEGLVDDKDFEEDMKYSDDENLMDTCRSSNTELTCMESEYEDEYLSCDENKSAHVVDNLPPFTGCPCMYKKYLKMVGICKNNRKN